MNPRKISPFTKQNIDKTLREVETELNAMYYNEIKLGSSLKRIDFKQCDLLKYNVDEKRKSYTAYCYVKQNVGDENREGIVENMKNLKLPIKIIQKTPIRVLKRRPLLNRERNIFDLKLNFIDEYHFICRLETESGTYIKEFIHGDFGRTRPCLAEVMGIGGDIDIIELDVNRVHMDWPP
ncbi:unnamed protein product [Anisakis simplex]|uniref:tRNA pseudouridine(55) synthase n=1 Tax=Anisakis simplex TaxID=6269 RepID=A0A0M3KFA4_ANISI|nr:unnamed protein product [Anisakis simplex]